MSALKGDSLVAGERWRLRLAARLAPLSPNFNGFRNSAFWSLIGDHWPVYGLLFLVGSENYIVPLLIPLMAEEFSRGVEALATMVTAYAITYAVAAPFLGAASDRLGRRPLIIFGGLTFLAGNLLVAGASSLPLLRWARAVTGLGAAMSGPAIWAHLADNTALKLRGRAIGLGMGAFALGQVIGLPLGSLIASLAGWRWAFRGIGLPTLPLLLAISLQFAGRRSAVAPDTPGNNLFVLFRIWRSKPVRLTFLVTFLFHAGNLASYTYLGSLLSENFNLSTSGLGAIGILVGSGSLLGSLIGGKVTDQWRAKGRKGAQLTIAWALLLALTIWVTTSAESLTISMVALILWFVASGAFVTTQQTLLTLAAPTTKATAVSWNNSIMHAGAGVGIWVIGLGLPHGLSVGTIGLGFGLAAAACAAIRARVET